MKFKKYQKVKRIGTADTKGISAGTCYIFPKIDGSNASSWLGDDLKVMGGSRNRELTLDKDNQGFYRWLLDQNNIHHFLQANPDLRLFGEWLVPHSLKTYRENAWRNFYVFDVVYEDGTYLPYPEYKDMLEEYDIEYIAPLGIVKDGNTESFRHYLDKNKYLIEDGKGDCERIRYQR